MIRRPTVLFLGLLFATAAGAGSGADIDKVNGSIRLHEGETAGKLSTVNGSVHLGDKASAESIETVNGAVELGSDCAARSIETVNGHIALAARTRIAETVEAVNGSIELERGADVAGHLSNVNGHIALNAAHVGGGIETVGGDVEIGADSHVEGGLLVERPNSTGWSWGKPKPPRIVIGPRAVVEGSLRFKREVELLVSDSAKVGPIEGATPVKFSGDRPNG